MLQNSTPVGTGFRFFGQFWRAERTALYGNILQEETNILKRGEKFWSQSNPSGMMIKMKTDPHFSCL